MFRPLSSGGSTALQPRILAEPTKQSPIPMKSSRPSGRLLHFKALANHTYFTRAAV
jgi:hypothetical protein